MCCPWTIHFTSSTCQGITIVDGSTTCDDHNTTAGTYFPYNTHRYNINAIAKCHATSTARPTMLDRYNRSLQCHLCLPAGQQGLYLLFGFLHCLCGERFIFDRLLLSNAEHKSTNNSSTTTTCPCTNCFNSWQ